VFTQANITHTIYIYHTIASPDAGTTRSITTWIVNQSNRLTLSVRRLSFGEKSTWVSVARQVSMAAVAAVHCIERLRARRVAAQGACPEGSTHKHAE
jgi:hypothetical protein